MMSGSVTESPPFLGEYSLQFNPSTQGLDKKFINELMDATWMISVTGTQYGNSVISKGTGFSVGHDGHIMTCCHLILDVTIEDISVRSLKDNELVYRATIEYQKLEWDLLLLKVHYVHDINIRELATDGSLSENERIIYLGHPHSLVGSVIVGNVAYPCVNDVSLPTGPESCMTYISNALAVTPRYRVMGDLINVYNPDQSMKYLHPLIPVIQCNGSSVGSGSSGGPIFNIRGEIVGMLVLHSYGFQIAIHVALLKKFLDDALSERGERQGSEKVASQSKEEETEG